MKITHANKALQHKTFTYYIKDYDSRKRLYTLENPITKDIKIITKEEFDTLYSEHVHPHEPGHGHGHDGYYEHGHNHSH